MPAPPLVEMSRLTVCIDLIEAGRQEEQKAVTMAVDL